MVTGFPPLWDLISNTLRNTFETEFNKLIDNIFHIVYGEKYKSIKQKRDLGSDGIIEPERVSVACYAPESYNAKKFKKKVKEDYEKFRNNYAKLGYLFRFITNIKLLGSNITYFKELCPDGDIWGLEEIISFIKRQSPKIRRHILVDVFGIPREFITYDIIEEIIYEIELNETFDNNTAITYSYPTGLLEKIEVNFESENFKKYLKRLTEEPYPEYGFYLAEIFKRMDPKEIDTLKTKVLSKTATFSLKKRSFEEVFLALIDDFSSKYPKDDEYKKHVTMLLIYIFEQCIIGKRA